MAIALRIMPELIIPHTLRLTISDHVFCDCSSGVEYLDTVRAVLSHNFLTSPED